MSRKLVLSALLLLVLTVPGVAAREPARPTVRPSASPSIAATPNTSQGACFVAGLNGSNETPAVVTNATGIGAFVLAPADPVTTTRRLTYSIAYTNTLGSETAAHIHRGAPGVAGPIVIPLPAGNPKEGVLLLNAGLVSDLLAGLLYVNIHTSAHPGGEIRGQMLPGGGCFSTTLSGAQETPPNTSPATGTGIFVLVPPDPVTTTRKLVYHIEFTKTLGLETAAHIHRGGMGVAGPIVIPLPLGSPKEGVLSLNAGLVSDLLAGLLYVNIHTGIAPTGEIRGQILPLGLRCYVSTLSGANENPRNTSTATGRGFFTLSPSTVTTTTLTLSYYITSTGILTETAAHFHRAQPGVSGPIAVPLPSGNPKAGILTLTDVQARDLMSGMYYVNIHSSILTQGEIRGQVVQIPCANTFLPTLQR